MFASNSHQVFRQMNSENAILPSKSNSMAHGTTSKTPAASSKQRRALGDISNRKQGGISGGVLGPKKTPGLRLQQQQQQRNPLTSKTPALSKKKGVAFLPRPTVNILPDFGASNLKSTNHRPVQKSLLKSKAKTIVNDPVDDIERSAGRLWVDQQDDYSCTSVSLPESNWESSYNKRHAFRVKQNKEEEAQEDAAYSKYIESAFNDDESSAMIGADVWIERTLSFDNDFEDELSFEAPSYCGDISF